jgi:hypothetical protein
LRGERGLSGDLVPPVDINRIRAAKGCSRDDAGVRRNRRPLYSAGSAAMTSGGAFVRRAAQAIPGSLPTSSMADESPL